MWEHEQSIKPLAIGSIAVVDTQLDSHGGRLLLQCIVIDWLPHILDMEHECMLHDVERLHMAMLSLLTCDRRSKHKPHEQI